MTDDYDHQDYLLDPGQLPPCGWCWLVPAIALASFIGLAVVVAHKAIPQAAHDACAAYCERMTE